VSVPAPVTYRDVNAGDLAVIVGLLNGLLATTTYEYTETPHTVVGRAPWFDHQSERGFPVIVAEVDGHVVGFASYGDFRDSIARAGFRHTVHVDQGWHRQVVDGGVDRAGRTG
jgi:phosphinothricin acetyltransferase